MLIKICIFHNSAVSIFKLRTKNTTGNGQTNPDTTRNYALNNLNVLEIMLLLIIKI